jgi:lysophospholipase L1-like esterase
MEIWSRKLRPVTSRYLHAFSAFVFFSVANLLAAQTPGFYLQGGDRVVFYGDSITEQNLYNQFVELYTVTRFPTMRVRFFGAGIGGDKVSGGWGGTIDERLRRDVFAYRPTVVTVMLGMNDGQYTKTTDEIQSSYTMGYAHLLDSIAANAPSARVTMLGPSPFDDVTRPEWLAGGYNSVMLHFADLDREIARKRGDLFVNFNPPVVALLEKAQRLDPLVAETLLPDRVHPELAVHWVMAETLLKGWNAPSVVSSVAIDGASGRVLDSQNAIVSDVKRQAGNLSWTATEGALPLPLDADNANYALLLKLTDIQQQLNRESLKITGLSAGQYELKIDSDSVGTFSAEQLAASVNLADLKTPMRSQAQTVGWSIRDRVDAHRIDTRMMIAKADVGAGGGKDVLEKYDDSLEDKIYEMAAPKPHAFSLTRVSPVP